MNMRNFLLVLVSTIALGGVANGSIIVTIQNTTIPQGQSGLVDVLISSDNPLGDSLQSTNFEFRITNILAAGRLEFANPSDPDPTFANSTYVFSGDSFDAINGFSLGGPPFQIVVPNDTYTGADSTNSGLDVSLSPTSQYLLVELPITTTGAAPPQLGDTFSISLVSGANTSFLDSSQNNVDFTSSPGSVTIGPEVSAVPEPTSLAVWAGMGVAVAAYSVRLSRRKKATLAG